MQKPKTFIFIGRSGCGKGTQAELLINKIKELEPENPILYLEAGARFRELISRDLYTAKISKKIMEDGKLQPSFLAIHAWSHLFIEQIKGNEHIILDGSPRRLDEAKILYEAFRFYNRAPVIINISVSREWSIQRLESRGRTDDARANIEGRLNWFDSDVAPAIEYFRTLPDATVLDINGEKTVEEVHEEIKNAIWNGQN